ncbi:MAG: class A beta-lactamase-related serine hydrolase [Candidatus Dadabacteria bacterium]|nr:MAG: class A beta-lactamase-related serine hydrolase [Candidatus Dadabacteria bacterium]
MSIAACPRTGAGCAAHLIPQPTMCPDPGNASAIQGSLERGRNQGLFGHATLRWFTTGGRAQTWKTGCAELFDVASLTKPLVTTLLVLQDCSRGIYSLDTAIGDLLPAAHGKPVGSVTLEALLRHRSGLPAWKPWYASATSTDALVRAVAAEVPETPAPTRYSDAGFILLGALASRERPLAQRLATELAPLAGLAADQYAWAQSAGASRHVAPSGFCAWRQRMLRGDVHDANAAVLGEIAGHAGLFATAEAVEALCRLWLVPPATARLSPSLREQALSVPNDGRPLGWDRVGPGPSQAGANAPAGAVGHLGFTGTSVWLDPATGRGIILLTNRTVAPGDGAAFRRWRAALHDQIWSIWS